MAADSTGELRDAIAGGRTLDRGPRNRPFREGGAGAIAERHVANGWA